MVILTAKYMNMINAVLKYIQRVIRNRAGFFLQTSITASINTGGTRKIMALLCKAVRISPRISAVAAVVKPQPGQGSPVMARIGQMEVSAHHVSKTYTIKTVIGRLYVFIR